MYYLLVVSAAREIANTKQKRLKLRKYFILSSRCRAGWNVFWMKLYFFKTNISCPVSRHLRVGYSVDYWWQLGRNFIPPYYRLHPLSFLIITVDNKYRSLRLNLYTDFWVLISYSYTGWLRFYIKVKYFESCLEYGKKHFVSNCRLTDHSHEVFELKTKKAMVLPHGEIIRSEHYPSFF